MQQRGRCNEVADATIMQMQRSGVRVATSPREDGRWGWGQGNSPPTHNLSLCFLNPTCKMGTAHNLSLCF